MYSVLKHAYNICLSCVFVTPRNNSHNKLHRNGRANHSDLNAGTSEVAQHNLHRVYEQYFCYAGDCVALPATIHLQNQARKIPWPRTPPLYFAISAGWFNIKERNYVARTKPNTTHTLGQHNRPPTASQPLHREYMNTNWWGRYVVSLAQNMWNRLLKRYVCK